MNDLEVPASRPVTHVDRGSRRGTCKPDSHAFHTLFLGTEDRHIASMAGILSRRDPEKGERNREASSHAAPVTHSYREGSHLEAR